MTMEKDIAEGQIGTVGAYDLEFKGGKLTFKVNLAKDVAEGVSVKSDTEFSVSSDSVLDALERAIPGDWDKSPIAALKALLKA
jgi:hypothetical protein